MRKNILSISSTQDLVQSIARALLATVLLATVAGDIAFASTGQSATSANGSTNGVNDASNQGFIERMNDMSGSNQCYSTKGSEPTADGGGQEVEDQKAQTKQESLGEAVPKCKFYAWQLPASALQLPDMSKADLEVLKRNWPGGFGEDPIHHFPTDTTDNLSEAKMAAITANMLTMPQNVIRPAQAAQAAQATDGGNASAEVAKNQAASAIGF